jgi:hypothetical protein
VIALERPELFNVTSTAALRNVRFAQIVLKNSIFRIDHNSEDRWRPR